MFDQMYDYVKLNYAACMMACRPVVIHSVLMSIIFEHYKQLRTLMKEQKVNDKKRTAFPWIYGLRQWEHLIQNSIFGNTGLLAKRDAKLFR